MVGLLPLKPCLLIPHTCISSPHLKRLLDIFYWITKDFGPIEQLYCFTFLLGWGWTDLNFHEVIWTARVVTEIVVIERSQHTPGTPGRDISQRSFTSKHNQPERARGPDSWWRPAGGQVIEGVVMTWLWPEGCRSCSQKAFKENCVELLLFLSQLSSLIRGDGFTSVPRGFYHSGSLRLVLLGVTCWWAVATHFKPWATIVGSVQTPKRWSCKFWLIWRTNMPTLTDRIQWLIPDKGVSVRIWKLKRS